MHPKSLARVSLAPQRVKGVEQIGIVEYSGGVLRTQACNSNPTALLMQRLPCIQSACRNPQASSHVWGRPHGDMGPN